MCVKKKFKRTKYAVRAKPKLPPNSKSIGPKKKLAHEAWEADLANESMSGFR
jgi:hypothetical protein